MKDSQCQGFDEIIERYLSGDVTKEEADRMEAHLAVCPHCQQAVANARTLGTHLNALKETPPEALLSGVMGGVRKQKKERHSARILLRVMPMAACLMLIVSVLLLFPGVMSQKDTIDFDDNMSGGLHDDTLCPSLPDTGEKEPSDAMPPAEEPPEDGDGEADNEESVAAPEAAPTGTEQPIKPGASVSTSTTSPETSSGSESTPDDGDSDLENGESAFATSGTLDSDIEVGTKVEADDHVTDAPVVSDKENTMTDQSRPDYGLNQDGTMDNTEVKNSGVWRNVLGILSATAGIGLLGFTVFLAVRRKKYEKM